MVNFGEAQQAIDDAMERAKEALRTSSTKDEALDKLLHPKIPNTIPTLPSLMTPEEKKAKQEEDNRRKKIHNHEGKKLVSTSDPTQPIPATNPISTSFSGTKGTKISHSSKKRTEKEKPISTPGVGDVTANSSVPEASSMIPLPLLLLIVGSIGLGIYFYTRQ